MSVVESELCPSAMRQLDLQRAVYEYHDRSKHRFSGYAKGPASLDWDAQPNPFRVYEDTETVVLPFDELPAETRYADAIADAVTAREFSLASLAKLLRLAFGITAWKELPDGTRWALRANPSSGNLHPTEAWVLIRGSSELKDGLYHYDCYQHALELRCEWADENSADLQLHIALSTIYWREAWKYGERAFRYCHLDIGHAAAALGFACAALGWKAQSQAIGNDEFDALLGLTSDEHAAVETEAATCLLRIQTRQNLRSIQTISRPEQSKKPMQRMPANLWHGRPNRLDRKPLYTWPAITQIAAATRVSCNDRGAAEAFFDSHAITDSHVTTGNQSTADRKSIATAKTQSWLTADNVVVLRRSAQAYDANYFMPFEHFVELLNAFFETQWQPLLRNIPRVHLIFAVHRVRDLTPGIYALARSTSGEKLLRTEMTRWSEWAETGITVSDHKLFRIKTTNAQRATATLCCQQAIASDCNFVTGFLAEFDDVIGSSSHRPASSSNYTDLFQEAGALAHAAYLRATALGIAGTGIGCFFDDEWHELLGIKNTTLQFVYHFATGKPLLDSRLTQRTGYFHLHDQQHRFARRFL